MELGGVQGIAFTTPSVYSMVSKMVGSKPQTTSPNAITFLEDSNVNLHT